MANICDVEMLVLGDIENVKDFYSALTHRTKDAIIGRGLSPIFGYNQIDDLYGKDEEGGLIISGDVKWSLTSALIDNAIEMREDPKEWGNMDGVNEVLTLDEACKKYHVNVEAYTWEPGLEFSEHYAYEHDEGETKLSCIEYHEVYNEETGEYDEVGGFEIEWTIEPPIDNDLEMQ